MKKKMLLITGIGLGLCIIVVFISLSRPSKGVHRLFKSNQFHYQASRTLGHAYYQGSTPGEVLSVIGGIEDRDEESWQQNWFEMANRVETFGENAHDGISKGNAFLRASNYYRTSEYFMSPENPDRINIYHKSVEMFKKAMDASKIPYQAYEVPFESGKMKNYYFPGAKDKPLVLICGGFDSINEESYFWMGTPLIKRGYPVILFEGPGQSNMIRSYGIRFTPDWHKVVSATIDAAIHQDSSLASKKKILVGISFGGLLSARAAAYEKRLDGLVVFGAPFDMVSASLHQVPSFAKWLYQNQQGSIINFLVNIKKRFDQGMRWGLRNGMWTIGGKNTYEYLKTAEAYTLHDVHEKITCPVLVFYGENDFYVSDGVQDKLYETAFQNAESYTLKIFKKEEGSAEHCQSGSVAQAARFLVSWMDQTVH